MRILFYNQAGEISGAERVLLTILQRLPEDAAERFVCAPPGALLAASMREGIPTAAIAPLVLGRTNNPLRIASYGLHAAQPVLDLVRQLGRFRPDVLYANSLRSGLVAVVAARLGPHRPRIVVHLHDPVLEGVLDRVAARVVGALADTLIAVSRYVADGFRRERAKIRVLYNAVDPEQYVADATRAQAVRHQLGVERQALLLVVMGQITPWKGQREALDALALVRAEVPDAHLLVAGSAKFVGRHRRYDNRAYERELRARAAQPDLAGAVHMSGEISDVSAVYAAATIVLVPSWYEAFAMVILEALAAQRPLIATAAGGNLEIISHGMNGWLVPPRDATALGTAALTLQRDAALRERLATNGNAYVRAHHTVGPYITRFAEILGVPV